MIISIIIPIYNVADYIPRCLDSIFDSNILDEEYEVICVNDGSSDYSSDIIRSYQKYHKNLILIEQTNAGVSVARNVGMEMAKGDYLLFVDPDDSLCEGALKHSLNYIKNEDWADMVICRSFKNTGEYQSWHNLFYVGQKYTPKEILDSGFLRNTVWGGLYNRRFLQNHQVKFIEGIRNGEDTNFTFQTMYYSNNIVFADISLYIEIGREGSASRIFSKQRLEVMVESIEKITQMIDRLRQKQGNKIVLPYMLYSPISNLIADTLRTKLIGIKFLRQHRISKCCKFRELDEVKFLKSKMKLLQRNFTLYYLLAFLKYRLLNK